MTTPSRQRRQRPRHRLGPLRPAQVLTNADLERMVDTTDEWIVSRTGHPRAPRRRGRTRPPPRWRAVAALRAIRTRRASSPTTSTSSSSRTLTPDYWMPSTAALVKEAIGNTRAAAMDVTAACSGLRLRVRHGPGLDHERAREARPRDRRGAADPLPRLHRPEHLHPVRRRRRRGRPVGLGRARRRPRHRADDRAAGRLHDLAARRRREEPAVGRDDRPRRALHPDGGQGDLPVRDARRWRRPRSRPSSSPASSRTTSACSSRTRPTSGSSRRSRRASTCRWTGCS